MSPGKKTLTFIILENALILIVKSVNSFGYYKLSWKLTTLIATVLKFLPETNNNWLGCDGADLIWYSIFAWYTLVLEVEPEMKDAFYDLDMCEFCLVNSDLINCLISIYLFI